MVSGTLGKRIKKEREQKGLSLRKFAHQLDIAPAYLVDIEKDRRIPPRHLLQRIADLLDFPLSALEEFDPSIPKQAKEWIDANPPVAKLLNLIRASSNPEKTVSDFESFVKNPRIRQPILAVYESELQTIGQESISWDTETGGDLFGIWGEIPIVYLATRAGPHALRTHAHFRLDVDYLVKLSIDLENDWGLRYFGDWHSHHRLGLQSPSSGDQKRIHQIASKNHFLEMAEMIITFSPSFDFDKKVEVNPYLYNESGSQTPADAALIVLKGLSPVRQALMSSDLLPEQRLSLYTSFPIEQLTIPKEPLGRLLSVDGLPIDQIANRALMRAVLELEILSAEKVEEHRTQFGYILVASTGDQECIGIAVDGNWPHQILQINRIDRKNGNTEELEIELGRASLISLAELREIFSRAKELQKIRS